MQERATPDPSSDPFGPVPEKEKEVTAAALSLPSKSGSGESSEEAETERIDETAVKASVASSAQSVAGSEVTMPEVNFDLADDEQPSRGARGPSKELISNLKGHDLMTVSLATLPPPVTPDFPLNPDDQNMAQLSGPSSFYLFEDQQAQSMVFGFHADFFFCAHLFLWIFSLCLSVYLTVDSYYS